MNFRKISIVIPTYNEEGNIKKLILRLDKSLQKDHIDYELVFVDDHSTDNTIEEIKNFIYRNYPIRVFLKQGQKGKAFSLFEGFKKAKYNIVGMIDADLQYPPEVFPKMLKKMKEADIVIVRRDKQEIDSKMRIILSKGFRFIFGKVLLGLNFDVQSGLKVFRKDILNFVRLNPKQWSFDSEFLFKSRHLGYKIAEVGIIFNERYAGKSKINPIFASVEIGRMVLRLRLLSAILRLKFLDYPHPSEIKSINYANNNDFLFLPEICSVKKQLYKENIHFFIFLFCLYFIIWFFIYKLSGINFLLFTFICINFFYLAMMLFKLFVIYKSYSNNTIINFSNKQIKSIKDEDLPIYTILIPLYREEEVIKQIKKAMVEIDYPTDKLDVIITLEEYDKRTIKAIQKADFPKYFKTLILPNVSPKTKPKALNVAFKKIKGKFVVIYDAEIIPDRDQLKKAYLLFKKYPKIACVQTLLDHYNAKQNLITKWFNAEFSFYYDMFLPGLQSMDYPLPLSGHSTHFRKHVLWRIGAWDPYNVTEDCELGIRIRRLGYKTAIMRSYSKEEATSKFEDWLNQRSRWMKGFMQTTLVHMRYPFRFKKEIGGGTNLLAFLFLVPGTVIINFINIILWIFLVLWLIFQPSSIKELFPGVILYISLFCFIFGNFIFIYLNLLGSYKRKRYYLVKYSLLSSIYWIMLSLASVKAFIQLITNPHYWGKTKHGAHLVKTNKE